MHPTICDDDDDGDDGDDDDYEDSDDNDHDDYDDDDNDRDDEDDYNDVQFLPKSYPLRFRTEFNCCSVEVGFNFEYHLHDTEFKRFKYDSSRPIRSQLNIGFKLL